MTTDRSLSLKEMLLQEAWADLEEQGPEAIDKFLCEAGIGPEIAVQHYTRSTEAALRAERRERFEQAKLAVNSAENFQPFKIVSFDLTTKQRILAKVRDSVANTSTMTIAARNRTISEESDIDAFLEACIRLGVIDSDGNLSGIED